MIGLFVLVVSFSFNVDVAKELEEKYGRKLRCKSPLKFPDSPRMQVHSHFTRKASEYTGFVWNTSSNSDILKHVKIKTMFSHLSVLLEWSTALFYLIPDF